MVGCSFKIKDLPFPETLILLILLTITDRFFFPTPFTSALSFNFTSFSYNSNITYERAFPDNEVIQLTGNEVRTALVGRATYASPLHLWDNASRALTDFATHFSFVIDSKNRTAYGDGLAFFLEPAGSIMPAVVTKGGAMGLADDSQELNTTDNHFVAVEFDIYSNRWDPPGEHVGINIKSMQSVANVSWSSNTSIRGGIENEAWISYNSTSHNLSVVFTGIRNNVTVRQFLSQTVDLRLHLPEWVTFGFSAATGNVSAMHTIYSWYFDSPGIAGAPSPNLAPKPGKNKKLGLAVGLGAVGCFLVGGLALVLVTLRKRNKRDKEYDRAFSEYMDDGFQRGTGPKRFSFKELARATNNFSDDEKLGQGGFGGVYKGFLRDLKSSVAIKRVSKGSAQGIKEYASEVKIISRLRHRNLVQLIGWCHERRELLLVYEFMPNRSLDFHLFKEESSLQWVARYKIARGLALALLYLHEEWEQCVVHRDIKSSNIMLDSNFDAKLGDFGLARLVDHAKGSQTTVLAGTMGYMAPECVTTLKASKESDVYSFGIVALEIACGRKPINPKAPEDQVIMVEWVWELYGIGEVLKAADPRLSGDFDGQQMERLMIVGLWCARPDRNLRPSIRQAMHVLNFEAPLPALPSDVPGPAYPPAMNRPTMSLSISSGTATDSSNSSKTNSSQFSSSSAGSQSAARLHSH
ncbi:L-type lectin-domain containing receptor kinase IX.1 [Morella rubra]|uniref:L-type lectin-domain containing receptor kinase IX.1 n=1 Tax=Morella rubra TaxID=262757 RepID=A0A6A1V1Y3_9ROSI|nr:L-type lectin-domain containing receptor kinase IX.1 [Morella rubra]KAB1206702.1 L-type lectin-domain containing receptor kinase IX.1 [Morella rubra]